MLWKTVVLAGFVSGKKKRLAVGACFPDDSPWRESALQIVDVVGIPATRLGYVHSFPFLSPIQYSEDFAQSPTLERGVQSGANHRQMVGFEFEILNEELLRIDDMRIP